MQSRLIIMGCVPLLPFQCMQLGLTILVEQCGKLLSKPSTQNPFAPDVQDVQPAAAHLAIS